MGLHDYVGPYRLTTSPEPDAQCSGYFHGSTGRGQHGVMEEDREIVVSECLNAIGRADFVFAYINAPDCFGTVAEIVYAHDLGKYVHLVVENDAEWDYRDYWFVEAFADESDWLYTDGDLHAKGRGRILEVFRNALLRWTARPAFKLLKTTDLAANQPAAMQRQYAANAADVLRSFSQIARWSADPRVRDEAERMVRRLGAG